MSASLIYVTTAGPEQAVALSHTLVAEQLVACGNVLTAMTSVYRWRGDVQQEQEAVLLLKTRSELVPRVIGRIRELHDYDCPCAISWPIAEGNPDYLQWIAESTAEPTADDRG